jgi:hypothetical protein
MEGAALIWQTTLASISDLMGGWLALVTKGLEHGHCPKISSFMLHIAMAVKPRIKMSLSLAPKS